MDKIIRTLCFDEEIAVSIIDGTEMVNEAIRLHSLSPLCAAALGRTLLAATFMSNNLKNKEDKLSITIKGGGEGGSIVVCGNNNLDMRGYIDNPQVVLPLKENGKLDVGKLVGKNGKIRVVKSMGLKEPYSSSCNLVSGEIAEDFTAYYTYSEQQPTAIALGVKIGKDCRCVGAGGVFVQPLPGTHEINIDKAEKLMPSFKNISTLIENNTPEKILKDYFGDYSYEEYTPKYNCLCSKYYIDGVVLSLGEKEADDIIKEQGEIKVQCHFCNKEYIYGKEDIKKLFTDGKRN